MCEYRGYHFFNVSVVIFLDLELRNTLTNYSSAWFFGTWPAPRYLDNVWGTNKGTDATCTAQAMFLQFGGMSSLLFNASLAIVYFTIINYDWRELKVRRLLQYLHVFVWVLSALVTLALFPLDFYHNTGPVCWIAPHPRACTESWLLPANETTDCLEGDNASLAIITLHLVPITIIVVGDSIFMCVIYSKIKDIEKRSLSIQSALSSMDNFSADRDEQDDTFVANLRLEAIEEEGEEESDDGDHQLSWQAKDSALEKADRLEDVLDPPPPPKVQMGFVTPKAPQPSELSTSSKRVENKSRRRSRLVAEQGILYIGGFFLTFGPTVVSAIVFLATGEWNLKLDRTSYFFISLQGMWNFIIFSRRRRMKTVVGALLQSVVWKPLQYLSCSTRHQKGRKTQASMMKDKSSWVASNSMDKKILELPSGSIGELEDGET